MMNLPQTKDINSIRLQDLNAEQLQTVATHAKFDDLKTEYKRVVKNSSVQRNDLFNRFITSKDSDKTQQVYSEYIQAFFEYIDLNDIHFLDVNHMIVDDYIAYLVDRRLSPASVKVRIASISSFYTMLARYDFVERNYFRGAKLPKNKRAKELIVPTERELSIIMNEWEVMSNADHPMVAQAGGKMIVITHLAVKYGFRLGGIANMAINGDRYSTTTKGKELFGKLDQEDLDLITKYDYDPAVINTKAVQFNWTKLIDRLHKAGMTRKFTFHSLRHYFAVKLYNETKDIYAVSRCLSHSSVSITQKYLESVGIEEVRK